MTLNEAIQSCQNGNFVSHTSFSKNESMHSYHNNLFYEDGANLSCCNNFDLTKEEWAQDGWFLKFSKEHIDFEKLDQMHQSSNGHMLQNGISFEDCFISQSNIT